MKSHNKLLMILGLITSILLFTCAPALAYTSTVGKTATKLSLSDSSAAVEVPDNFYNTMVNMELVPVDNALLPATDKYYILRALDVKITGSSNSQVGSLIKPMRLIFPFNDIDFKRACNMDTSLSTGFFRVGLWNSVKKDWQQLPSTVFWNGSQGVVECETTLGAGRYALLWNTDPHAQLSSIAENQIRLMINYNTIQLLTPPYVKSDRVLVPLRVIAENMGAKVSWDPGEQRVDIVRDNHVIKLWLGSTEAKKDQQTLTIDISPEAVNGSTYVPLRFISEALGAKIEWDEVTQTAKVVQTSL